MSNSGGIRAANLPLWDNLTAGVVATPRNIVNDSTSFISPIVSGTEYFTKFIAENSVLCGHIGIRGGSVASAAGTLCRVGIYTVTNDVIGPLVASCANLTALAGAFATVQAALTVPFQLRQNVTYACGIIQVATTCASLLGAGVMFTNQAPTLGLAQAGLADLAPNPAGLTQVNFTPYFEFTT